MLFIAILLAASSAVAAIENKTDEPHITNTVYAKPLKKVKLKYPKKAFQADVAMEGWVDLRYVINEDGTTSDIIVEKSTNQIFEKPARKVIKQLLFSPAQQNGHSVKQFEKTRFEFKQEYNSIASKEFAQRYASAYQFLKQNNLEEFKRVLDEIEINGLNNFYEQTYFQILTYELAVKQNDKQTELSTLENLLLQKDSLSEKRFILYAEKGFELAIHASRYDKALNMYEIVQDAYPESPFIASYKPFYKQITDYLASDEPNEIDAMIGERDFWRYELSRNGFIIDKVEGQLTNLELRCDFKHSELLVETGNLWTIPESWGECSVYIYGDKDTRFTFRDVHNKKTT
jgi:TonB family protein